MTRIPELSVRRDKLILFYLYLEVGCSLDVLTHHFACYDTKYT